jgi:hypothetical protein
VTCNFAEGVLGTFFPPFSHLSWRVSDEDCSSLMLIVDRLLMERRREHGECETREGGRGCLVFGTKICTLRKTKTRWQRFKQSVENLARRNSILLWMLYALFGIGVALGLNILMPARIAA